jgi:lipoprotein-releasing system permease protein
MVVEIIGIEPDFVKVSRLDTSVKTGVFELQGKEGLRALVSIGIQQSLNISLQNVFESIKLAYPKRTKIWKTATGKIFNTRSLPVAGIVQMDENRVYLPLSLARELMEKPKGMNYLDVYLNDEVTGSDKIKSELEAVLGPGFVVKNETEQHSDLFKIMRIEKLFVFLALGFIILISTFNLFVSSTMLVLDKTRDLKILSAMGFSPQKSAVLIRLTGLIISFLGLNLGLFFGIGLCLLQKQFGFIPLGMASTMIRDYPVSVHLGDLFLIGLWVMISSYLAMIIPSKRARTITEMSSVG